MAITTVIIINDIIVVAKHILIIADNNYMQKKLFRTLRFFSTEPIRVYTKLIVKIYIYAKNYIILRMFQ